jgi:hypothetical protein
MGLGDFTPRERAAIGKAIEAELGRRLGTGNHYYKRLYDRVQQMSATMTGVATLP